MIWPSVLATHSNTRQRGLRATVTTRGTVTFYVRYSRAGKRHQEKLGRFPEVSVADARTAATAVLTGVETGVRAGPCRRTVEDLFGEYWPMRAR